MDKARLIEQLGFIAKSRAFDPEAQQALAVESLLMFIDDEEITAAFRAVPDL